MKNIILIPTGGLANRMRVFASGVQFALDNKSNMVIYWTKNKDCYVNFNDVFKPFFFEYINVYPLGLTKTYLTPDKRKNLYLPGLLRKLYFSKQYVNINKEFSFYEASEKNNVYITTCHSFYKHFPISKLFIPNDNINDKIEKITKNFSKETIGIHIRRSDNLKSIEHNSIDDFLKLIKLKIKENSSVKIYLSTDDIEVKNKVISFFPDNILYNEGTLNRNSVRGIQDAIIDLWCLSKTNNIFGSFYSSYSEIAAELGNIPIEFLKR